jgi:hypothetical protein
MPLRLGVVRYQEFWRGPPLRPIKKLQIRPYLALQSRGASEVLDSWMNVDLTHPNNVALSIELAIHSKSDVRNADPRAFNLLVGPCCTARRPNRDNERDKAQDCGTAGNPNLTVSGDSADLLRH